MAAGAKNMLMLAFKDKAELYKSYMSFVRNGGLFVKTTRPYRVGDEVFLMLTLPEETERLGVAGRVVWVTPPGAQGSLTPGIGVQFLEQDQGATQSRIETILAGALGTERPTYTM